MRQLLNKLKKQVFIIIVLLIFSSCEKIGEIAGQLTTLREQTVLALNDGINALENGSADWQFVTNDLEQKIDKRIEDVLTYNIPYIINLASQRALSTVLCVKENIKDDVIYYLKLAKSELLTGIQPPLPATKICLTSISTIDLNAPRDIRNQIIYTGYYIHTQDSIKAYLENINGEKVEIPRSKIGFPDISNITVSLADYSDDVLSDYTHLNLYYNNDIISSIAIDKKIPDPPVIITTSTNLTTFPYTPQYLWRYGLQLPRASYGLKCLSQKGCYTSIYSNLLKG